MVDLFKHQKAMLARLRQRSCYALFAEPGTGKTLPMEEHLVELLKSGRAKNAIVICPKAAMGAWTRDFEKFPDKDKKLLEERVTIINYDKVWRGGYEGPYDVVVLDEAHCIKSKGRKRTDFCLKLGCKAKFRYILTGTPVPNGALESLYTLITFLDPYMYRGRIYGRIWEAEWTKRGYDVRGSYWNFLDRYCVLDQYHKPYRYFNIDELQDIIAEYSIRQTKAEVFKDMPEQTDEIVDVELKEPRLYKRMMKESALEEYDKLADNPLARMTALRQLCSGFITTDDGIKEVRCEKLDLLEEILDSYPDGTKIVIFANFKFSIAQIKALLDDKDLSYLVLDGDQKDKNVWKQFQSDPSIKVMICQYQSANAGIDLFASSTMIFYEPTLQSVVLEQAKDRIHRTGQTEPCTYIHMITKGTVEEAIYSALSRYEDFSTVFFKQYMSSYQRTFNRR